MMVFEERYVGSDDADYFRATDGATEIFGHGGDDDLAGGAGDDWIDGGTGNDLLEGGGGDDRLIGGDGTDAVSYAGTQGEVHVDLSQGYARDFSDRADSQAYGTDLLESIEVVIGSAWDDSFIGSANRDDLRGGDGNDHIDGRGGSDVLRGGRGSDVLDGGDGFDYADYFYTQGVTVDLRAVNSAQSSDGVDQLRSIEGVIGSTSADSMIGNAVNNRLIGYAGSDVLSGMGGDDRLEGGRGRDVLTGGTGADKLYGGWGLDRFVFDDGDTGGSREAADWIGDFSQSDRDRIDLRMIDADGATRRNEAFTFIGDAAFSGTAGELRFAAGASDTVIEMDVNGDGAADALIVLAGQHNLVAGDFML